jgi:hypothetical protein
MKKYAAVPNCQATTFAATLSSFEQIVTIMVNTLIQLSDTIQPLAETFNRDPQKLRFVAVLSPT